MLHDICQLRQTFEPMTGINRNEKDSLAKFIKGLVQCYNNDTGDSIEQLHIIYEIKDNMRVVKEVQVLTEMETPAIWLPSFTHLLLIAQIQYIRNGCPLHSRVEVRLFHD